MKISKNIPYLLIIVAIILIIFEISNNGFHLDNDGWQGFLIAILLFVVGLGLLYNSKRPK